MATTYTIISSQTLASNAASVTFSAIPSTYTDLVLKVSARSDSAANQDLLDIQFNGDTATNYSRVAIYSGGDAGAGSQSNSNINRSINGYFDASTSTANTFGNQEIYIPSYVVSQSKPFSNFGVAETNSSISYMGVSASLWRNTAAITSILAKPENGSNFLTGSSFYLYGISNA